MKKTYRSLSLLNSSSGGQAGRLHHRVGLHEEGEQGGLRLLLPPVERVEIIVVKTAAADGTWQGQIINKLNGPHWRLPS